MYKNKKHYWFYIEPYSYLEIVAEKILLLNTLNQESIIIENNRYFNTLFKSIIKSKNGVVKIDDEDLKQNKSIFSKIRNKFIGEYISLELCPNIPVNFYPLFKINNDFYLKNTKTPDNAHEIFQNATIFLSLNADVLGNPEFVKYRKILNINNANGLNPKSLISFLKQSRGTNLSNIEIFGLKDYKEIEMKTIISIFKSFSLNIHFNFNSEELLDLCSSNNTSLFNKTNGNFIFKINYPVKNYEEKNFNKLFKLIQTKENYIFSFFIESKKEYDVVEKIISKYTDINYNIYPIFNKNLSFFKSTVFNNLTDILKSETSMVKIFKNKKINSNYFGNLIIANDGQVYTSCFEKAIGNISKDNLSSFIQKSISKNESWFLVRNSVMPCNSCLLKNICPPISDYEFLIGRYDLCNVKYKIKSHNFC